MPTPAVDNNEVETLGNKPKTCFDCLHLHKNYNEDLVCGHGGYSAYVHNRIAQHTPEWCEWGGINYSKNKKGSEDSRPTTPDDACISIKELTVNDIVEILEERGIRVGVDGSRVKNILRNEGNGKFSPKTIREKQTASGMLHYRTYSPSIISKLEKVLKDKE